MKDKGRFDFGELAKDEKDSKDDTPKIESKVMERANRIDGKAGEKQTRGVS